jgi:hypothetical protein
MRKARGAVAVLLGLVLIAPGYVQGQTRSYTLTPYDVPATEGNNTSLFDLLGKNQFIIGTYFSNRQNAFGAHPKREGLTDFNTGGSFVNFVVAISKVGVVGSVDLPNDRRVGTIWPRKSSSALWEKALGTTVSSSSSDREPIIVDIENYRGTALLGLNRRGHVVGAVQKADLTFSGFVIRNGALTIFDYPGAQSTQAEGIRKDGTIVGTYVMDNTSHGFLLHPNGQFTSFDAPQACETFIFDTNDAGDLAGAYVDCTSRQMHGYVFTGKAQFLIVTFPGEGTTATEVLGLDEQGNIAGRFDNATGRHGFLGVLE